MANQPPPTPWIPNPRFADESLLLEAQPIFDTSLGDESVWGGGATVICNSASDQDITSDFSLKAGGETSGADMTFDLGDYLPEEVVAGQAKMSRAQAIPPSPTQLDMRAPQQGAPTLIDKASTSGKQKRERESSDSLPVVGPPKRAKPHPKENDDLFSEELPELVHPRKAESSKPAAQLSANTASARLKTQLKRKASDTGKEKIVTPIAETESSSSKQSGSALSRYLARSTVLAPKTSAHVDPKTSSRDISPALPHPILAQRPIAAPTRLSTPPSVPAANPSPALASETTQPSPASKPTNSRPSVFISPPAFQSRPDGETSMTKAMEKSARGSRGPSSDQRPSPGVADEKTQMEDVECSVNDEVAKESLAEVEHEQITAKPIAESTRAPLTGPMRRKPTGLTKPITFSRPLGERPQRTKSQTVSTKPPEDSKKAGVPAKSLSRAPLRSTTAFVNARPAPSRAASKPKKPTSPEGKRDLRKSPIPSSFAASSAFARPLKSGSGQKSTAEPVKVKAKDTENARGVFDRLASTTTHTSRAPPAHKAPKHPSLQPTVPLRGHTPGKSSALRAQQRAVFDKAVREKMEEQERVAAEERKRREEEEEEAYRRQRKETVIWAKPVPGLYREGKRA
ncbi:hypothetical protein I350_04764 [Cryptococcus amylolentus CBS 6273]|uniref:TPX2 C-terminal domain-containing protein n=1 Tax=Cryptococcus amylolentus CBS 6273 TaxID=1296118 RepID=A0A1E3JXV8_9TREE|nr:hypothetical protein I350_04764 [Cryptococcus amylolentus CBS 6273]